MDDDDVAYSIITSNTLSADSIYNNLPVSDVPGVNIDNDTAAVTLNAAGGLTTTEAGGTASYSVVLASQPTAGVTLTLLSDKTAEGTVTPATITFTAANWNSARSVTVTGVDDKIMDGNVAYRISTTINSTDIKYSVLSVPPVNVTNLDNDVAAITVTPTAGLVTSEAGGTASFSMRLDSQPTANVVIGLASSKISEGTVAPASFTFTVANWNIFQTATITGVDDVVADGNVAYTIITAAAVSADANYSGRTVADVAVTNNDNDQANILVSNATGLMTSESGTRATFSLVLTTLPTSDVSVAVRSSNVNEGIVDRSQVTFSAANWNQPQVITITGVDDALVDGDVGYTVVTEAAISSDAKYNGINPADVQVLNRDNDAASINLSEILNLETTESGGVARFRVVLSNPPNANVSVAITSSNTNEGKVSPAVLVFTSSNWSIAQSVTISGVDDATVDGDVPYSISLDPSASLDNNFRTLKIQTVEVINRDNDIPVVEQPGAGDGLVITAGNNLATTESGGKVTFTIQLARRPNASVSVSLRSSNSKEGVIKPANLTFDAANWDIAQTVTVTGVDDTATDGAVAYQVLISAPRSDDASFASTPAHEVSLVNQDNEEKVATGAFSPLFLFALYAIRVATQRARQRRLISRR